METTKHRHFVLCKPYGYLSQFVNNDVSKHKKKLLGRLFDFPDNSMAIGRLDEKSEGLLFITTDGKMSEFVRSAAISKEYYAQVDGIISPEAIEKLTQGVEIGFEGKKYLTKPCQVTHVNTLPQLPRRSQKIRDDRHGPTSWLSITLTEGKFRQVRKMTAAVGFPTLRLVRVRIGPIALNDMQAGDVTELPNFLNI